METKSHFATLGNYEKYCEQLEDAVAIFPSLSIVEKKGFKILKGILDISNDDMRIVGNYLIEIHYSKGFPFRFPYLYEVGDLIVNSIDWHKYPDNRCCITVPPDEILKCKAGITILEFINVYCFSFLANHVYRKINGHYLNGEYSHDKEGILEFYTHLFRTTDKSKWQEYFAHVFRKKIFSIGRNRDCFCGSKKKFKFCHKLLFDSMWDIGELQIYSDFKLFFL